MVTVTIHVQPYNVCCGCLFDEQLHKSWTFLQIPSKTLQNWSSIVPSASACLVPIPSSSLTDLACPATNTPLSSPRYDIFSFAMRPAVEMSSTHLPAFFLTGGVVTPFALSRFNDLTIKSACRGSGSYSIHFFPPPDFQRTYRFRIRTSLASSRPAPRIARTFIVHRTFNFTQRFTITQGYEVLSVHHYRCIKCLAMWQCRIAHTRLEPN